MRELMNNKMYMKPLTFMNPKLSLKKQRILCQIAFNRACNLRKTGTLLFKRAKIIRSLFSFIRIIRGD